MTFLADRIASWKDRVDSRANSSMWGAEDIIVIMNLGLRESRAMIGMFKLMQDDASREDERWMEFLTCKRGFGSFRPEEMHKRLDQLSDFASNMKLGNYHDMLREARRLVLTDTFPGLCEINMILSWAGARPEDTASLKLQIISELGGSIYLDDAWIKTQKYIVNSERQVALRQPNELRTLPSGKAQWNKARALWLDELAAKEAPTWP